MGSRSPMRRPTRGGFIRRHDRIKGSISSLATYCGLELICEPSTIFTAHLPQRPLNQVQAHQTRQGLRPDFSFYLPTTSGQPARSIADIKTISLGNNQLYKPGGEGETAVKRRAGKM